MFLTKILVTHLAIIGNKKKFSGKLFNKWMYVPREVEFINHENEVDALWITDIKRGHGREK